LTPLVGDDVVRPARDHALRQNKRQCKRCLTSG